MTKNLPQKIDAQLIKQFDEIITKSAGATADVAKSLAHDVMILNGIQGLKQILGDARIKPLIISAAGNEAGFLCDKPNYTYEQLIAALIPRLLEGYRLTGNEINIISGRGMPVKRGKYRRILELTSGFRETIGTPQIKDNFALIKCSAKWKIGESMQSIGVEDDDPCILKIKYNAAKYDTIDKVLGLAQSKLYTRVLTRLTGQFIADEPESNTIDITPKNDIAPPPEPEKEITQEKPGTPPPSGIEKSELMGEAKPAEEVGEHVAHLQKIMADPHYASTVKHCFTMPHIHITQVNAEIAIEQNDNPRAKGFIYTIEAQMNNQAE